MNKETYLRFLRAYLTNRLPAGEVEDIMNYYTEYFADAGEGREEAVMAELGSPERLAQQILGERRQEELIPSGGEQRNEYTKGSYEAPEYTPAVRSGIPTWVYVLLLVMTAVFVGPVLLALVFGLGLAGGLCVLIGLGVTVGGLGRLSFFGLLYQAGGGLIAAGVGLLLLLGAVLLVKGTGTLLRWFRNSWVEGGRGYEEGY